MRTYDIIVKKRDGLALTDAEIQYFIKHYTAGQIPDYQASALLMAIYLQGMSEEECAALTNAMAASGDQMDLSSIRGIKVDKHSTGGVGDTTTLVLAPLVASIGVPVAKMSGRGLGHTGGTIDKLESIPGFHAEIANSEFIQLVNQFKVAVVGQSGNLTPADKLLYSLRDVTATVDSIPLIASSIMSKKMAAGADAIVLDVKTGSGAFMKEIDEARKLAKVMVSIGEKVGRKTTAVISDMSQPLGHAVGNALEVKEAIATLKGEGPADLTELCLVLGSQMAVLGGAAENKEAARELLQASIASGKAFSTFKIFIENQGGNSSAADQLDLLPEAAMQINVAAGRSGYVETLQAALIGQAAMMLGAGRETKESQIDLAAGILLHKKVGDPVEKGETLFTLHTNKKTVKEAIDVLQAAVSYSDDPPAAPSLIYEIIE